MTSASARLAMAGRYPPVWAVSVPPALAAMVASGLSRLHRAAPLIPGATQHDLR
jgi:hypothetical protein